MPPHLSTQPLPSTMSQSQSAYQIVHVGSDPEQQTDTEGQCYAPQSAHNQTTQRLSHSSDSSAPLFALYLRTAEDYDAKRLRVLEKDTDQILVFCGLFSATVAALTVPSISEPSPQESSTVEAVDHSSEFLISTSTGADSPSVSIFVISCWLLSLLLSISCALVAISLRRWAKPRSWVTSARYSLLEQARLRTLLADRIERLNFIFLVGALHILVHISFSIFLVGLFSYLGRLDVLVPALFWIVLSILVYAYFTALPLSRTAHPSSYPLIDFVVVAILGFYYGIVRILYLVTLLIRSKATGGIVYPPKIHLINWYLDFTKFAEEKAQELAPYLDDEVLRRTFDMLRSDDDLEQFFEAIPGFSHSEIVDNPRRSLDILGQQRLAEALVGFWNRTLSSNRVSESVKGRRLIVCIRVIEAADLPIAVPWILHIFSRDLRGLSGLVEIGHSLGILRNGSAALPVRGIISRIISINDERNKRWITLAIDELGISKDVLRRYLSHGDSVSLANLIHITRQFFHSLCQRDSDLTRMSLNILPSSCKFDILNTLPELQHEFCALWNEIIEQARISGADDSPFVDILVEMWGLYVVLHGADAAFTASAARKDDLSRQLALYSLCMATDHRIQEAGGSITSRANHSTTATSPILLPRTTASIVKGIADASLTSSLAEPISRSSSGTGDAPRPDEEIAEPESPYHASTISIISPSNPQAATVVAPNIARRTSGGSSATLGANGNPQNLDPTESTQHPGELDLSVIDANCLRHQDHDSSENTA